MMYVLLQNFSETIYIAVRHNPIRERRFGESGYLKLTGPLLYPSQEVRGLFFECLSHINFRFYVMKYQNLQEEGRYIWKSIARRSTEWTQALLKVRLELHTEFFEDNFLILGILS